ncbi:uncharacterized protein LOC126847635 isoform X21 [Adelges cooleyi]|uniref:uncharacterized protein LOC126847635 isoform X19 n=1 Tax=Adelges cooleyi TaxID=133065 RepID=UPI0021807F50|nr:uncharacterized protein LOC126847635 isoform X19 [Adelges cooleyi]XP_050443916.1 uncharacterized protein LOC126847635 isoform X20 [Adelges cooleyi]XP_050443917.1 uncharacterized protein LOC126847635 isoform X21 [Adelges cooleyi]
MAQSCPVCKFTFARRSNMLRHQRQFNHYLVGPHQPGSIQQTPDEVHIDLTVDDDDESVNSIYSEPTTASQHTEHRQIHVDVEVWIDLTTEENSEADNFSNIGETATASQHTEHRQIHVDVEVWIDLTTEENSEADNFSNIGETERVPVTMDSINYSSVCDDQNIDKNNNNKNIQSNNNRVDQFRIYRRLASVSDTPHRNRRRHSDKNWWCHVNERSNGSYRCAEYNHINVCYRRPQ